MGSCSADPASSCHDSTFSAACAISCMLASNAMDLTEDVPISMPMVQARCAIVSSSLRYEQTLMKASSCPWSDVRTTSTRPRLASTRNRSHFRTDLWLLLNLLNWSEQEQKADDAENENDTGH